MYRSKIIFRMISVFIVFALMITIPLSLMFVREVNRMTAEEEAMHAEGSSASFEAHRTLTPRLVEEMLPYIFYIMVMALIMAIFISRKMLFSLQELQRGSKAMKDGHLDVRLDVTSDDEIGNVMKTFNEMASSLLEKNRQLIMKDIYIKAMLDPLWVVDEDNRIVDINPSFSRVFGYKLDDVLGVSVYDFLDEENEKIMREQIEGRREKGLASTYEIKVRAKSGDLIPVLISGSPIFEGESIKGKVGIIKDFREHVSLRDALRYSRDYVETIMDSIEDEIIVVDRDFRIIKANMASQKNYGKSVVGCPCHHVSHGLDSPCWTAGQECPAQTVFLTGKTCRVTHMHLKPSGETGYHEIVASPVVDASGQVIQVIELIRDVTDRLRHEDEISRKNRELTVLNGISGILSRSLRADEIFTAILDRLIGLLGMEGGGIFLTDDAKKEMHCQYHKGISDEYIRLLGRLRLGEDIPGKVAVTGELFTSADLSRDRRVEKSIMKHSGMKGYCCAPVRGKEKIIGVLCIFSFKTHDFTSEEESILNSIGEMAGISLENIRLYEQMRGLYEYQRKRREDEKEQLLTVSSSLGGAAELKDVMPHVVEIIRNIFRADFAWVLKRDVEGNYRIFSSTSGPDAENVTVYSKEVCSVEEYAVDRKMPTIVSDIRDESRYYLSERLRAQNFHSAIAVPLYIGSKNIGVYSLYYIGSREFREDEIHFLRIIGNILAVSMEMSEYYAKSIREKGLSGAILQSVADGIVAVDPEGRIISVNKAFETMTGVAIEDAIGVLLCDALRGAEQDIDFRLAMGECLEAAFLGERASSLSETTTAFGTKISLMINSSPVIDEEGRVVGVVNLVRDISREKEIDRMKTEIIRSVSHEFRTPLSAIIGLTEMLLEDELDRHKIKDYLGIILREGSRLSGMVSDLLSIAKIESGKGDLKLEVINADSFLGNLAESVGPLLVKKKAHMSYDIKGIKNFVGDREKLLQVLINLVDNSLSFSDEGCRIDLMMEIKDGQVEVLVSDNGWGIPEEDMPHLAESFFRGRHGQVVKGTGLGLTLCKEIMSMHNGTLSIKSRLGEGTEVRLLFPFMEAV